MTNLRRADNILSKRSVYCCMWLLLYDTDTDRGPKKYLLTGARPSAVQHSIRRNKSTTPYHIIGSKLAGELTTSP
ncbi:unnamed protein product [Ceratitis capitata]|uniref:(Mediterranean fruit fly) hypothetical protein n=1 Tax=Ceratitis capitata TaxID=7213 RepID=A0A811UJZ8_CERCA|nr:unnamed protein product [Ceratitis capitata]